MPLSLLNIDDRLLSLLAPNEEKLLTYYRKVVSTKAPHLKPNPKCL